MRIVIKIDTATKAIIAFPLFVWDDFLTSAFEVLHFNGVVRLPNLFSVRRLFFYMVKTYFTQVYKAVS